MWAESTHLMFKKIQKIFKKISILGRKIFGFSYIRQVIGICFVGITFGESFIFSFFQTTVGVHYANPFFLEIQAKTEKSFQLPVEIFKITKGYSFFHPAIDLATDAGTAVLPILPGKVEKVSRQKFGYGNYVIISHGFGYKSLYAHLVKIAVKEGQEIQNNTIVGFVGSTGWSTGPHLHLEIAYNNRKINPKTFFEDYLGKKLITAR